MINKILPALKLILSIWRPDFRKTTGWLFITTGLLLLSPPFVQDIIYQLLAMQNLVTSESYEERHVIGTLLTSAGIIYHLLYLDSISKRRALEPILLLSLLALVGVAVFISL